MLKKIIKRFFIFLGYQIVKKESNQFIPPDIEKEYHDIILESLPYTLTSVERVYGLISSVKYIVESNISGDIVECGVWRGGSVLASINSLLNFGSDSRDIWLYDTFEGMSAPTEEDYSLRSGSAKEKFNETKFNDKSSNWCFASLDDVKKTLSRSTYSSERIHYIKGMVEETIPSSMPEKIALLRLDTDWYESTKHELEHLYPLLVPGGILIIDDYGHWNGCRKAVDEYFCLLEKKPLLLRLDYTGRVAIKPF